MTGDSETRLKIQVTADGGPEVLGLTWTAVTSAEDINKVYIMLKIHFILCSLLYVYM